MKINKMAWKWARPLYRRSGKPLGIVWHNAAATHCTAEDVHRWHLGNGWSGIGYHFFVDKKGLVWQGRPAWAIGSHCLGGGSWLGVCFEGNYDREEKMSPAQQKAGKELHAYLRGKYGSLPDRRHRDMPGNSTACPGKYFPFTQITK